MHESANDRPRISRRAALFAGTAVIACLALPSAVFAIPRREAGRCTLSFDEAWRFARGDIADGASPDLDDAAWRQLDLPHDWSIEDAPGAPPTSEPWSPPLANWTVARIEGVSRPRMGPLPTPAYPEQVEADGPPLRVGPFDPASSDCGWGTGWVLGGVGWYRKRFTTPEIADDERVEIMFDGAFCESEVWLNGVRIGANDHGYGGFAFDLTPHLRRHDSNLIAVRVANEGQTARWYSGSGINRHVWLSVTGPVRVAPWGIGVLTPQVSAERAHIEVEVELDNHLHRSTAVELSVRILDVAGRNVAEARGEVLMPAGAAATQRLSLDLPSPRLWGPDTPYLYTAEASVRAGGRLMDRVTTRFGVRTIAISAETGLMINGQPVKLKGGCIHADHGILGAAAIDAAETRKIELLKRFGYNAVRLSHNMFPPATLDACDEAGIIVIDEIYDTWEEEKLFTNDYSRRFRQNWRRDVRHWIRRDRNHPSVVFWSIGNEIPERVRPRGAEIAAELREAVLALDTSRPITAGINGPTGAQGEPAHRSLDVVGYNYQQHAFEVDHAANPNLVFMSTEQAAGKICEGWRLAEAHPWVLGEFVWTAIDYLGEVGVGATLLLEEGPNGERRSGGFGILMWDYPAFQAGCGEIDILGSRKPQGLYRDVLWGRSTLELLVHRPIPPGTYEWRGPWGWYDELESWTWPEHEGRPITIRAYTSGDEVRLYLNGAELERKRITEADELTATFETTYQPGDLIAVAYKNGQETARKRLQTAGAAARVQLRAERTRIDATPNDLAYVFAEVVDAEGRKVPDAAVELSFALEGAGSIRATGSANPRGIKSFSDPRSRTFHGEAAAVIQGGKRPGRATLHVSSPGLEGDSVRLRIG